MNRFATLTLAAAALLGAISPLTAAGNVWARDDGQQGNRIQLEREFAGCHMMAMGAVPPRSFGTDWAAGISFNIQAGAAIDAIMGECMRSKGWIKQQ